MITLFFAALLQITPGPVIPGTSFVTIGDGLISFGTYNGADHGPFQAALKAAPTGGVIEVLPGHYSFSRSVTIGKDGVTVRGSAGARIQSTGVGAVGTFLIQGDQVRLSGMHWKVLNPAANQSLIKVLGDAFTLDHCTFSAIAGAPGMRLVEAGDGVNIRHGTLIESNTFLFGAQSQDLTGITLRFGLDLRMIGNEFRKIPGGPGLCRYAVEIEDESKGTITSNSFQNLGDGANPLQAVLYSNAETEGHHFAISGNFIENCQTSHAIHLSGGRFCAITGNVFGRLSAATGGAIHLTASVGNNIGESNVISGNQFHNIAMGVKVDDSLWTNINGNQFTICGGPMIEIGPNAHGALISSNQFIGATALSAHIPHAISISTSGDHLVHDNICSSQNASFTFTKVVSSTSSEASILDNVNS